ncbi:MAG: UDP-N-acetylmuramate--alanine ligase, partial [Miltoncostaeaceae bacterium]|nr:UDP-N-acetylmuramate--alanine ligase [Miltoncostaeaceae bacterium]
MSGLARLAAEAGYRVSGTDRDDSPTLAALARAGVRVEAGHRAEALPPDAEALVVSSAIAADNPELRAARARGLPVLHRTDLLTELTEGRRLLAVAGAHGKSTTSAMLALALGRPSAYVGATIGGGGGTGAVWGEPPFFVAEADESDRSLLRLRPELAILTNVEHDHHATFRTAAEVEAVFRAFLRRL